MAEKQKPQFIFWVKEERVFRPAELKMPEDYIGYDLRRNIQLEKAMSLSPDNLTLISSHYLGPIKISEEVGADNVISSAFFQRKRDFKYYVVQGIVQLAEEVAKNEGVPCFSLTCVQSPVERTWKFKGKEEMLEGRMKEQYKEQYILKDRPKYVTQPEKPIISEFMLHPTAQLYVLRK